MTAGAPRGLNLYLQRRGKSCVIGTGLFFWGKTMEKEKKAENINRLSELLADNGFVVATTFQGVSAQSLAQVRWALAAAGVEYRVVKNTLVRIAAQQTEREQLMQIVEGATALGFAVDAVQAAKAVRQQARGRDALVEIRGGLLGDRVLAASEVMALADLPPRDVLIAQLAAQLQAPVSRLHRALSWPLQGFRNVLQARVEQLAQ